MRHNVLVQRKSVIVSIGKWKVWRTCDTLYVRHRYGAAGRSASLPASDIRQRAKHTVMHAHPLTNQTRNASCWLFELIRSIVMKFTTVCARACICHSVTPTQTRKCNDNEWANEWMNDYPYKLSDQSHSAHHKNFIVFRHMLSFRAFLISYFIFQIRLFHISLLPSLLPLSAPGFCNMLHEAWSSLHST